MLSTALMVTKGQSAPKEQTLAHARSCANGGTHRSFAAVLRLAILSDPSLQARVRSGSNSSPWCSASTIRNPRYATGVGRRVVFRESSSPPVHLEQALRSLLPPAAPFWSCQSGHPWYYGLVPMVARLSDQALRGAMNADYAKEL
jgi:hypothetical protein